MRAGDHIKNELIELGANILVNAPKSMPFATPFNYFETLEYSINSFISIYENTEPQLDLQVKMPFGSAPKGYFDGLAQEIISKVQTETEWSKSNPYQVSSEYFEHLPNSILAKIKEIQNNNRAKKVPLFRSVQLAASLALIIFVGLGVLRLNQRPTNMQRSLSELTTAEIAQYVNENIDDFDTDIVLNALSYDKATIKMNGTSNISIEEVNNYLDEEGLN